MNKTCEECKFCYGRTDGAGFVTYYCKLKEGIVVGVSNYLDGNDFNDACDDFERG